MKILVTGGAGFIGSHLVDALVADGHQLAVVDDLSTGRRELVNERAQFHEADVADEAAAGVIAAFRPEAVFHLAAQGDLRRSVQDPIFDANVNIIGSLNVITAARQAGVRHFIFVSSGGAIYGDTNVRPTPEQHPARPASPYGIAKLTVEHYLRIAGGLTGMRTVALRCANVYGPRQNGLGEAGVVAIFIHRLLRGETAEIHGDGEQTRDFVFVGDVVAASLLALSSAASGEFNIGTGIETSVNAGAELIRQAVGQGSFRHGPAKPGEQRHSSLDCRRAAETFGWQPRVAVEEGIAKTVAWFRQQEASSH